MSTKQKRGKKEKTTESESKSDSSEYDESCTTLLIEFYMKQVKRLKKRLQRNNNEMKKLKLSLEKVERSSDITRDIRANAKAKM